MLKLKLQYFDHLMWRATLLEKIPMLGKPEGRRKGWQSLSWLDGITNSVDMNAFEQTPGDCEGQRSLECCSSRGHRIRYDLATEWKHRAAQSAKPHHYSLWFHFTHRQFISNVLVSLDDLLFCCRHQFTATCWHCHDPKWSHHEDHQESRLILLVCSFTYSSYMCPYASLRPSLHWYSSSYSSFGLIFFQTIL